MPQRRRPKGEGSTYCDKHGQWWAQITIDGRLIRRRCPSRKAASERLAELRRLRDDGMSVAGGSQTVESFLNEWYNAVIARRALTETTRSYYRVLITNHILPYLDTRRLDSLEHADMQRWIDRLSPTMAPRALALFRDALGWAVRRRYIRFDPTADVIVPVATSSSGRAWTTDELARLFVAAPTEYHLLYQVLVTLGLRLGEALALQWTDIDWQQAAIAIARQVQEVAYPDGTRLETNNPPKTAAGIRTLPLPPRLLRQLERAYAVIAADYVQRGVAWSGHGPIFTDSQGGFWWPHNLSRRFRQHRAAAGLPTDLHLHLLRHTCASWLDATGASEATRAAILGHAKKTVTERYTHPLLETMRAALTTVERTYLNPLADATEDVA